MEEKQSKRNKRKNREKENDIIEDNKKTENTEKMSHIVQNYLLLDPTTLSEEDTEKVRSYYMERIESAIRLKQENNAEELYDLAEINVFKLLKLSSENSQILNWKIFKEATNFEI